MIRLRPRRAAAVAVLTVAATVATAAAVAPVAAAASAATIVVDSVSSPPGEPGLLSVQAEAPSPITSLTVHIDSTPELTVTNLTLTSGSGSAQDGTWTVQTPITQAQLSLGTYQVTVDATDSGGDTVTGLSAPDPFFFGLYPAVTIGASATTLSYSQQSVTFGGQVTAYSPAGLLEDVADQQVSITGSDGGSWSASTDQDGNYSVTVTPNLAAGSGGLAGSFSASVASSPTTMQASSSDFELTGDVDPVQVTVALSKSVVNFGAQVTLSGTAQYQSDGVWLPFAESTVDISGTDFYSGGSVPMIAAKTDSTGSFKVVLPAQPTTTWTANPQPNQYLAPGSSELGLPNSATLTVVLPTRTTSLHIAYNPAGQITASGCLGLGSAVASFRDLSLPADADLYLQYSRTSSGPWRTLGSLAGGKAPSCRGGTGFSGVTSSPALSGHYRVSFTGQLLYQRSVSASQHAATVRTRIIDFSIKPHAVTGHGRIRVSGRLQQKGGGWKGLGGVLVKIYVKPAGGTTWYWYRRVHPAKSGEFSISFADPVSGHWAAGYGGNASHLQTTSRILYVAASGTTANVRRGLTAHSLSARATHALLAAR